MPTDFDAASGESLHPAAREVLLAALDRGYADPRRLHKPARDARLLLDNAREVVAECLGLRADEVTFTASGTEAVHRGVLGLLAGAERPATLGYSAVEHSSVLHAAGWAAKTSGTQLREIPVAISGRVDAEQVREVASTATVLAIQTANHEVGTVQPVDELDLPTQTHLFSDACAAIGRVDLPRRWSVAAGSAHKWGGPAGVGLLLVRKGAPWRNPFPADDRIDERTAGFENVPAALAAAAALRAVCEDRETHTRQRELIDHLRVEVAKIEDVEVVGDAEHRLPHLVTFSCLYVDGEAIVNELDRLGYGVASGSACSSSTLRPSHVLAAMGVLTHGNVRLSLGRDAARADVDGFLTVLPGVIAEIRGRI